MVEQDRPRQRDEPDEDSDRDQRDARVGHVLRSAHSTAVGTQHRQQGPHIRGRPGSLGSRAAEGQCRQGRACRSTSRRPAAVGSPASAGGRASCDAGRPVRTTTDPVASPRRQRCATVARSTRRWPGQPRRQRTAWGMTPTWGLAGSAPALGHTGAPATRRCRGPGSSDPTVIDINFVLPAPFGPISRRPGRHDQVHVAHGLGVTEGLRMPRITNAGAAVRGRPIVTAEKPSRQDRHIGVHPGSRRAWKLSASRAALARRRRDAGGGGGATTASQKAGTHAPGEVSRTPSATRHRARHARACAPAPHGLDGKFQGVSVVVGGE